MQKIFLTIASITGALGVILGAFGAHALKAKLAAEQLQVFETGVKYQMYHTFALIAVAMLMDKYPDRTGLNVSGYCFTAGIILFSGSLYLLSCREVIGLNTWKWLGPITPLGGLSLIIGWVCIMAVVVSKYK